MNDGPHGRGRLDSAILWVCALVLVVMIVGATSWVLLSTVH